MYELWKALMQTKSPGEDEKEIYFLGWAVAVKYYCGFQAKRKRKFISLSVSNN